MREKTKLIKKVCGRRAKGGQRRAPLPLMVATWMAPSSEGQICCFVYNILVPSLRVEGSTAQSYEDEQHKVESHLRLVGSTYCTALQKKSPPAFLITI